jgi:zinc metalloprotease ZmpB
MTAAIVAVGPATAAKPAPGSSTGVGSVFVPNVPHCLRPLDTNLHYPSDLNGEVHHDGQIWSRALWDIRQNLGNATADTIILQGSFDFPGTTMPDLAARTVAAAQQLYGNAAAKVVPGVSRSWHPELTRGLHAVVDERRVR